MAGKSQVTTDIPIFLCCDQSKFSKCLSLTFFLLIQVKLQVDSLCFEHCFCWILIYNIGKGNLAWISCSKARNQQRRYIQSALVIQEVLVKTVSQLYLPIWTEGDMDEDEEPQAVPLLSIPLFKLHGDLSQVDRTKIYFAFCKAERGILFCTDVGKFLSFTTHTSKPYHTHSQQCY